jgi:hypothetical protein
MQPSVTVREQGGYSPAAAPLCPLGTVPLLRHARGTGALRWIVDGFGRRAVSPVA